MIVLSITALRFGELGNLLLAQVLPGGDDLQRIPRPGAGEDEGILLARTKGDTDTALVPRRLFPLISWPDRGEPDPVSRTGAVGWLFDLSGLTLKKKM